MTPAMAAFAGPMLSSAGHTVADAIQNCTLDQTNGSADLNCPPDENAGAGANGLPSESDLTQQNEYRHH